MNEEYEEIVEEEQHTRDPRMRQLLIVSGLAAFVLIVIAGFSIWYFLSGSDSGNPVAAPRDTSFGNGGESSSALASDREITLTPEQIEAAGFEFATVGETLEGSSETASTTGVVSANEYRATPINAYAGGVVRRVFAELGEFVRQGETIATISSDQVAMAESKYLSMKAELSEAEKRYKRALSLSSISEESRNELDRTTASLRTAEALLSEKKSNYQRSRKLVEIGAVSQKNFERVNTEYETAKANLAEAENRFDRAIKLLDVNPARNNELDQSLTKLRIMQADLAAQRESLLVLGVPKRTVDSLKSASQIDSTIPILAPISGTLTERTINGGETVAANSKVGMVTDLSAVWVIGQVYEKELGKVKTGSGANIQTDSYPGVLFRGTVTYIDPEVDERTRTANVRIETANPGEKLKLGMYVDVALATVGGSEKTAPLVPKEAIQIIDGDSFVFLATDKPNVFRMRQIRTGDERDGMIPVLEGIFVGDRIVTLGSFLLRSEFLKINPEGLG
ncbi:MAG: efflux RND transporter periplasmic adaptor subunit [Acidobacteria bacterium]|nr:MAG: efflux RND transporter periplasmic adaptor subunit [Acidobacteriota bacterium]REJ98402.1 MAG: efflux RND transporter periplasmic adaptor subunit [Acidobacteriota bacterium]REK17146.1 MAG: efflux RND transporter periplasmic adaptor subunit [Acidobacteriota bacterium]REK43056.1 MAG: efflux RND transporter periplasmic adaptor subunit [Acidobacteriota bacterium]